MTMTKLVGMDGEPCGAKLAEAAHVDAISYLRSVASELGRAMARAKKMGVTDPLSHVAAELRSAGLEVVHERGHGR
jgi:hypothetical protein